MGTSRVWVSLSLTAAVSWLVSKANILIADDGRPLVTDFGRSKIIDQRGLSSSDGGGTIRFLAPEIILQNDPQDQSDNDVNFTAILTMEADVYAFSMVGVQVSCSKRCIYWCSMDITLDFVWTATLPQDN